MNWIKFLLFCAFSVFAPHLRAEVVRIEIEKREPFANGQSFGEAGAYEILDGRLFFEIDPNDPTNGRITDLKQAAVNERGKVEFWSDFFLLKPVDPKKGNGRLLYDVHNRGNKLALWTFNEGERTNEPTNAEHAGNEFLLERGWSLLWTGWNGDVAADGTGRLLAGLPVALDDKGNPITGRSYVEISVDEDGVFSRPFFGSPWGTPKAYPSVDVADNSNALLTMRPQRSEPPIEVPREEWAFARFENGEVIPDPTSLYMKEGLKPGWLYDLVYPAKGPRVSGLGLAGLRDAVSFFRRGQKGVENPLGDSIEKAAIFGISQSGRVIHHFLYEGLNLDTKKRPVFDGAISLVPGAGKGIFNYRFGMATSYSVTNWGNLFPAEFFPFAPMPHVDPVNGKAGDTLSRLRESGVAGAIPKLMFVQSATEYWSRAASLLHADVEGKQDLEIDPSVRIYSIAGAQHLGGGPTDKGICQNPRNPLRHRGPVLRALLVALDAWMTDGTEPPESRYPRIDDGTLVTLDTFSDQFSKIPGAGLPEDYYRPYRLDSGPRWHSEGIADNIPPKTGPQFQTLVPAVDVDGNELAGIRLPEIEVPIGTYMGWNLRDGKFGAGGLLAGLHGSYLELPKTKAEREKSGDPRRSILERYPTRESYLAKIAEAGVQLVNEGFLLEEDAGVILAAAAEQKLWPEKPKANGDFPGPIRLSLPEVIYATQGIETNVYFDNVGLVMNPANFVFDVTCAKGSQQAERWTYTPGKDDPLGDVAIKLEVRDAVNEVIARASSTIRIVPSASTIEKPVEKSLLIMGDSLTAASVYSQHLVDLAGAHENFSLKLIGSRVPNEAVPANRHEGYGGWTAIRFATKYTGIARGGPYRECGSPFLYQDEGAAKPALDFARYCREFNDGKGGPDFVTILLGCNDTFSSTDDTIEARIDVMFEHYETLVKMIHKLRPETQIGALLLVPGAASQDAFGTNYKNGQTRWQYKRNQQRVVERMLKQFGGREDENLFIVPANVNLDCVNNYPAAIRSANSRTTAEIRRMSNGVHPSAEGYRQIGDSIWCWMMSRR